jgi:hypothetical protein
MKITKLGREKKKKEDVLRYTGKNTNLDALIATICKWYKDSN